MSVQQKLEQAIARAVEAASPKQIILFGSAATGELTENSDLDLLVVVADGAHRRQTAHEIYRNLFGLGFAVDVIVVTESDLEERRSSASSIVRPALEHGKVVYDAA